MTREKADKSFQEFKLWISQRRSEKAVFQNVASFAQLESACTEKLDEDGTNIKSTPDVKFAFQDTFYLALGKQRLRTMDKTKDKTKIRKIRREMLGQWLTRESE